MKRVWKIRFSLDKLTHLVARLLLLAGREMNKNIFVSVFGFGNFSSRGL